MRIEGLPPAMLQALLAAASPKVERAFAAAAEGAAQFAPPAALPPAPQNATTVQMLVALAAAEPEVERRRKAAAETDRGLSMLERLHEALASGVVPPERLEALAEWAGSFETPDDPGLASVAREVELRVRVELAKHEMRV